MTREELEKAAADKGITVDGRWSDKRLSDEIAKANGDTPAAPVTVDCEVIRAIWDENEKRINTGEIIPIEVEKAMDLIEAGIVKRVRKPE